MKKIILNKTNISPERRRLIVYLFLIVVTFAVYWQVNQYDFVHYDDNIYVNQNPHVQSGITFEGVCWAFTTEYFYLWNPLVWLSFMADYQLFGLKAGGYHLTNLIFHILSTLLLFWLFNRMTKEIWKSAFVAAIFALHPLHVESVAWIAERKDVLSAFFWMLTLCFYVYYAGKPVLKRYFPVIFSFIGALMCKPTVVTLPMILILLDYWPLRRFKSEKGNLILWQLREKMPLIIISTIIVLISFYNLQNTSLITIYSPYNSRLEEFSLSYRLFNPPVAFVTYLIKTFWPQDMSVFYPFPAHIPVWEPIIACLLILVITTVVIIKKKRHPYLFVGWLWYAITLLPVMVVLSDGNYALADRYHYLSSIGIAVMIAWGIPFLFQRETLRRKILFPAVITLLIIMSMITWKQCGYWKNSITLFTHALNVTKNNYKAHNDLAIAFAEKGKINEAIYHYNQSINIVPDALPYNNLGNVYADLGQHKKAMDYYNEAIHISPDYADAYYNRGLIHAELNRHQLAIDDYNEAIRLKPSAQAFNNRGNIYNRLGLYGLAIEDYNNAILLERNHAWCYINRASAYFNQGNNKLGCIDAQKACDLGNCNKLKDAKTRGLCR